MTSAAFIKMHAVAKIVGHEIKCIGKVNAEDDQLLITDIYMIPQIFCRQGIAVSPEAKEAFLKQQELHGETSDDFYAVVWIYPREHARPARRPIHPDHSFLIEVMLVEDNEITCRYVQFRPVALTLGIPFKRPEPFISEETMHEVESAKKDLEITKLNYTYLPEHIKVLVSEGLMTSLLSTEEDTKHPLQMIATPSVNARRSVLTGHTNGSHPS